MKLSFYKVWGRVIKGGVECKRFWREGLRALVSWNIILHGHICVHFMLRNATKAVLISIMESNDIHESLRIGVAR